MRTYSSQKQAAMGNLPSSLLASAASALLWPLAAGAAVVVWAKARAAARARRVASMESQLRGLYRTVEAEPIPQRLSMVVEALEEGEELTTAGSATGKVGAATPFLE
jgi:hypothetical protein